MALGPGLVGMRRLLPGERPATENLDEIRHWYAVYAELWEGCLEICDGLPEGERAYVLARAERFHDGFLYWTERRREYFIAHRAVPATIG